MRAGSIIAAIFLLAGIWAVYFGGSLVYRTKTRPTGDIADIYAVGFGWVIVVIGLLVSLAMAIALVVDRKARRDERK